MNSTVKEKIHEHIAGNRGEIIDFLKKLISFQSVTGNENGIQNFITDVLKEMGLETDVWEPSHEELRKHPAYVPCEENYENRPNVVGIFKGSGGGRSLLFNGHVDVIPVGDGTGWAVSPWKGEIKEKRLYGRGASDMKSGLAAMTMALKSLLDLNIKLKGDVILEYTVDEERTGNGTLACVVRGYKADAGICCETSSLHVQPACIGRIWFEIFVRGKPAGIQRRWEGVNAIEKGYGIVEAVSELENIRINKLEHPLYPDKRGSLPCMVGVFQSGSFPSAFPDTCLLKGSIATLPGEDTEQVKQSFVDYIIEYAEKDSWLKEHLPEISFSGYCGDPAEIEVDHPVVRSVCTNFKTATGAQPKITGRQGAADTRYLIQYGETPSVIFGPGLTEQMHSSDEWVNIDDVVIAAEVLAYTILDWCEYQ
jgi:acetylornithine deacetylase